MRYFLNETERKASHSSCYFEFQNGYYHDKCWLEDSISISDEFWDELRLSELFAQILPDFDYYGCTTVTRKEWTEIQKLAGKSNQSWRDIIEELTPWVNACFSNNDVFTICGI